MSVPLGNVNGRNLVIASVGTSVDPSINYQESQETPTERPNGGDLLHGDLWYNDVEEILYLYTNIGWTPVGLQKDYVDAIGQDLSERITKLDTLCAGLEDRIDEHDLRLTNGGL